MNQYHYNLKWRDRKSFLSLSVNSQSQDCQKSVSCNNEQHFHSKIALFKQWLHDHWSSWQVSKNLWNIWHGDKTCGHIIYPPCDVLFYQSWSFKMVPKRMILCLGFVSLTFLIMTEQFGQILLKWKGFATSFSNFWQISSDKICCNWVAKFLIKGGGNFVQIGVSCSRGSLNDNSGAG